MAMRPCLSLIAVLVGVAAFFTPAPAQTALSAEIDSYLNTWLETGRFMGSVLVARGDEVIFSGGYGLADVEQGIANSPDTRFRLGSMSKQFTAAAVLQLQERGLLDVNDAVSEYLPEYPNGERITIHQLLNHSSGIPDYARSPSYPSLMGRQVRLQELIAIFEDAPLLFAPGSRFYYSNSNYVLLTAIIERVSGQAYADYLKEHIFAPLGMRDSGYAGSEDALPQASGYIFTGEDYKPASFIDMSVVVGAGGLYSSVNDLYKWDRALYTDALLDDSVREAMFSATIPAGPSSSGEMAYYGYGWFISEYLGRQVYSHSGGINGFSSEILRFPDDEVVVIVLSNLDAGPVLDISKGLAAIVFDEPYELPVVHTVAEVDSAVFRAYVGRYALAPNFVVKVVLDGERLYIESSGQNRIRIYPSSETEFFLKVADITLTFVTGQNGEVQGLIWRQNGRDIPAARLE